MFPKVIHHVSKIVFSQMSLQFVIFFCKRRRHPLVEMRKDASLQYVCIDITFPTQRCVHLLHTVYSYCHTCTNSWEMQLDQTLNGLYPGSSLVQSPSDVHWHPCENTEGNYLEIHNDQVPLCVLPPARSTQEAHSSKPNRVFPAVTTCLTQNISCCVLYEWNGQCPNLRIPALCGVHAWKWLKI